MRAIAGLALIAIGALALLSQVVELDILGLLFLPTLAIIFLAWGLLTRTFGLLIPGGILAGIGAGSLLVAGPTADLIPQGTAEGAVFLLAFAGGWALITLLSPLTKEGFQWWPLIPGGILGLIGLALLAGETGLAALKLLELAWPLALIGLGIYILLRRSGRESE